MVSVVQLHLPAPALPRPSAFAGPLFGRSVVMTGVGDDIITRAQAGDATAFRKLYERHRVDVARLVFRMLGRRSDLDDVVQEVFVQVHRSLRDFRGQSKFTTWLHRVTVNVVLMVRRSARSRPVFADEAVPESRYDEHAALPDEEADRRERMRAFARVLEKLADKKRDVFVLHELEGLAPAEIGRIVGAPVLTVRTRLFYARREIEKLMLDEPVLAAVLERGGFAATEAEPRFGEKGTPRGGASFESEAGEES